MPEATRQFPAMCRLALVLVAVVVLTGPTPKRAGLATLQKAEGHFADGEFTAAEALFEEAIAELDSPTPPERLAALYLDWNRPDEGLAAWRTLPDGDPKLNLDLLAAAKDWPGVEVAARRILHDPVGNEKAYEHLTQALLQQSRCPEAYAVANEWVRHTGDDSEANLTAAILHFATQPDSIDAPAMGMNEELHALLMGCRDPAECYCRVGETLLRQKEPALAACVLARAVNVEPNDAYAHAWFGTALEQLGETDIALLHFQQATEIAPDEPLGWLLLGMAHFNLQHFPDAERCLLRAQTLDPENPLPCLAVAAVLAAQSRYMEIPTWTYAALERAPIDPEIWKSVARFYLSRNLEIQGEPSNAAEGAARLAPQDAESWMLMGWVRLNAKEYDGAIEALQRAISYDVDQAEAHHFLGLSLRALGRSTEAEKAFIRAKDLGYGF